SVVGKSHRSWAGRARGHRLCAARSHFHDPQSRLILSWLAGQERLGVQALRLPEGDEAAVFGEGRFAQPEVQQALVGRIDGASLGTRGIRHVDALWREGYGLRAG